MSMTNPLARVRGLGSAKDGTHHWIVQRMTAVALIPLTLWFVVSLISLIGSDLVAVQSWLSSPFNAVMMILTLVAGFHHAQLGLQVVIEDYVHHPVLEVVFYFLSRAGAFFGMALGIIHVLRLALGG